MLVQHRMVGYPQYYRGARYAMKHSLMHETAVLKMKALHFWSKHGIHAASEAFSVSHRTLYWWRQQLNTGGTEALIPRRKAPFSRRTKQWHPEILKEIRRLRVELPNLGKEQIFVRLTPWCEHRNLACPSVSTIGRMFVSNGIVWVYIGAGTIRMGLLSTISVFLLFILKDVEMKRIWLTLAGLFLATQVAAAEFTEGKQYVVLERPATARPEAVEFFSFYCPACFTFENTLHIPQMIRSEMPSDGQFKQYHVDFLGPLGKDLSQAWAVANVLGVEQKVAPVLFEGIQKTRSIKTPADIRAAFEKIGVKGDEYDAALSSFMVSSFVAQQAKAAQDFQVEGAPSIYINGKFRIEPRGFDAKNNDQFVQQYGALVKFLLQQK